MAAPRLRRVSSRREMESIVDDYVTQGYQVVNKGEASTPVRKKTWGTAGGHILWAVLTVWWTLGLGNLVYALIAHYGAEQVFIKIEQSEQS